MSGDSNMAVDSAMDGDSTMSGDANMMGDAMGGDSGHDAADSMSPDAADAGANDAGGDGSDGSLRCTGNNSACNETGTSGLCKAGVCSDCVGPADDAHCTTAYGSTSRPYLCLGGACIPGDCRISSDCNGNPSGGLCGVSTPNVCGKCTSDQQCAGNSGGPVCDTASGQCVAGTCPIDAGVALGGVPGTCSANASDICCTGTCQPAPASHACCPGINAAAY
ncbi:MAG: hypothetical protein M3O46_18350, partial [Myxococcota bacterium]|nr:hypothetical protein [Myxococcota bacterium]